jgi:hypothetical protein
MFYSSFCNIENMHDLLASVSCSMKNCGLDFRDKVYPFLYHNDVHCLALGTPINQCVSIYITSVPVKISCQIWLSSMLSFWYVYEDLDCTPVPLYHKEHENLDCTPVPLYHKEHSCLALHENPSINVVTNWNKYNGYDFSICKNKCARLVGLTCVLYQDL